MRHMKNGVRHKPFVTPRHKPSHFRTARDVTQDVAAPQSLLYRLASSVTGRHNPVTTPCRCPSHPVTHPYKGVTDVTHGDREDAEGRMGREFLPEKSPQIRNHSKSLKASKSRGRWPKSPQLAQKKQAESEELANALQRSVAGGRGPGFRYPPAILYPGDASGRPASSRFLSPVPLRPQRKR